MCICSFLFPWSLCQFCFLDYSKKEKTKWNVHFKLLILLSCWGFCLFVFVCLFCFFLFATKTSFRLKFYRRNSETLTRLYLWFGYITSITRTFVQLLWQTPKLWLNKIKMCSRARNGLDPECWAVAAFQTPRHRLPQPNCSANFNCSFCLLIQQGCSSSSHPACLHLEGIGKHTPLPLRT